MPLIDLDQLNELNLADKIRARVVNTDNLSVAHVRLDAGAILPEHAHINEQIVNVVEGELELTVDGEPVILTPGKVMVLPPNLPHSGRALTDVYVVDVFHPVREDFVKLAETTGGKQLYDND